MTRNYSDPQLDALIDSLGEVDQAQAQAGPGETGSPVDPISYESAEMMSGAFIGGVQSLAEKKWPVVGDVLNDTCRQEFINKSAPLVVKHGHHLNGAVPVSLIDFWREWGAEIRFGMFCGGLVMQCRREIIQERERERMAREREQEKDITPGAADYSQAANDGAGSGA